MKTALLTMAALTALTFAAPAMADDGYCREYTRTIYVGGYQKQGYGTACLQPDGSWQIVAENTYSSGNNNNNYYAQPMPVMQQTYVVREPVYTYYRPRPTVLAFNFGNNRSNRYDRHDRYDRWDRNDRHDDHRGRGHH